VGFSANNKGYIGLGGDLNSSITSSKTDMYEYDPVSDSWRTMTSMPTTFGMEESAYFVLCGKLIVTLGNTLNLANATFPSVTKQTWMFDPANGPMGTWTRLPDFSGNPGLGFSAVGFALGNTGYVVGGDSNDANNAVALQMWKYTPAIISVSGNVTICQGLNTTLSVNGNSIYNWFPSTGLSNIQTASDSIPGAITQTTASPLSTITYTITEAICGQQYASIKVTVLPVPTVSLSASVTVCPGGTANLSASGGTSYLWSIGSTVNNISVSPVVSTNYNVSVFNAAVSNGLCSKDTSIEISVPFVKITSANNTICLGTSTNLSATAGGTNYLWNTGATTSSITVNPIAATTYSLSETFGLCILSASNTVDVNPLPVISTSGNASICGGNVTILSASGGSKYLWSDGSTKNSITVTPLSSTSYTVIVTSTFGCSDSSSIKITLLPIIALTNSQTICSGSSSQLSASGGNSYSWNTGSTNNIITVSPTSTTGYTVTVSDNNNCSNVASALVTVNTIPSVTVCCNTTVVYGQSVTLAVSSGTNTSANWMPNADLSCTACFNPTVNSKTSAWYYVTVTDTNGCQKMDSVWIYIKNKCGDIFIPNAFSPNGDNENNILYIKTQNSACIQSMVFDIYDRWGVKVFESIDINTGWDGKHKGKEYDSDVFAFQFQATLIDGTVISKKGNISLIK